MNKIPIEKSASVFVALVALWMEASLVTAYRALSQLPGTLWLYFSKNALFVLMLVLACGAVYTVYVGWTKKTPE